jgi:hypothetical protein
MRTHKPTCLEGPRTADRSWWRPPAELFRASLVEEVRRDIAAGTYDTPEKWEIAVERLLKRLEDPGE